MKILGFKPNAQKKGIYYDGHERDDVVLARRKYLTDMSEYEMRMKVFEGENMEVVIEPSLNEGESEIVLVSHDESCFHANDDNAVQWTEFGKETFKRKNKGKALMVSSLLCPCHGVLQIPLDQPGILIDGKEVREVTEIIEPGGDTWWTNEDMVKQVFLY